MSQMAQAANAPAAEQPDLATPQAGHDVEDTEQAGHYFDDTEMSW